MSKKRKLLICGTLAAALVSAIVAGEAQEVSQEPAFAFDARKARAKHRRDVATAAGVLSLAVALAAVASKKRDN